MAKEFTDVHTIIGQVAKDYQYKTIYAPDWLTELWGQIWQFITYWFMWLLSKLAKLFSGMKIPFLGKEDTSQFLIIIFLMVLGMAIAFIIWQNRRKLRHAWTDATSIVPSDLNKQPRTSLEWRQQANEFKEKGQYREACRSLHRACLQMFDEKQLITFAPARSNYEYILTLVKLAALPDMQSRQDLRKIFQTFSNTVDALYFGNHLANETEFEFCLKCLQEVESYLAA